MKRFGVSLIIGLVGLGCYEDDRTSPPMFGGSTGVAGGAFVGTGGEGPVGLFGNFTEPVVVAESPPPPLSGGTLLAARDGKTAVVSDPDRDQVLFVDLEKLTLRATIPLQKGEEPGRLVDDAAGRVHVVLRSAGTVATIDPVTGTVIGRQAVCQYPRGLAYDANGDAIHVACAGGELVTLPAAGGAPSRQLKLDSDLRDVVVDGNRLLVSRFRAAELLVVEADGRVSDRLAPLGMAESQDPNSGPPQGAFSPAVAWRTIPARDGGAIMVAQEEQTTDVVPQPGGYGSLGCGSIVRTSVSLLRVGQPAVTLHTIPAPLPLDIAASLDGSRISIAAAGAVATPNSFGPGPVVTVGKPDQATATPCGGVFLGGALPDGGGIPTQALGQVVAVARDKSDRLILQTREPSSLVVGDRAVILPGSSTKDTGHQLFHMATNAGLACASCHPEGREDGHTWKFTGIGPRRTQSVGGGLLGTEPFHWNGDMNDFPKLVHEVFSSRMSGPSLKDVHIDALAKWIDKVPAWKPPTPTDGAAVARGQALFNDAQVGCATCHLGAKLTNNKSVDVGTGGEFQVPSLVGIVRRAPYIHSGCAATLLDRFGDCGGTGDSHGHVSTLLENQRADLTAYLETL